MFWLMNGLDKFLNRQNLDVFTWFGKDRTVQFGGYFEKTGISDGILLPLLYITGVWELILAIPFIIALCCFTKKNAELLKTGFFWSGATFVGFAFFDVIFGDRAELWEHGTFFILVISSFIVVFGAGSEKAMDK
jgi:hypothetical protein